MMNEVRLVQNPALGAVALWRFCCGYYSGENRSTPFPLLFIILPMVYRADLLQVIKSTQKRSGLQKFIEKISQSKIIDSIYSIHQVADEFKLLTLESYRIAESSKLLHVDPKTAYIFPLTTSTKQMSNANAKDIIEASEKLGVWCSQLTLHEISVLLKVRF